MLIRFCRSRNPLQLKEFNVMFSVLFILVIYDNNISVYISVVLYLAFQNRYQ